METKNFLIVLILLTFFIFSCEHSNSTGPENNQPQTDNPMTFSKIQSEILTPSCALSNCHGGFQRPNLRVGQAYNNIVDAQSSRGTDYIEPGDADNSYLFRKIAGTSGIVGDRMPKNAPNLTTSQIDSVRSWIERGAPND